MESKLKKPQSVATADIFLHLSGIIFVTSFALSRGASDFVSAAVTYGAIYCIGKSIKWARKTFAVIYFVSVLPSIFSIGMWFSASLSMAMVALFPMILQGGAVYFLYRPESNEWFERPSLPGDDSAADGHGDD